MHLPIYEHTLKERTMSDRHSTLVDLIDVAAKADPGYDQSQRWTWLDKANRRILPSKEADCSAMTIGLVWLAGYPVPDANIDGLLCYTGNEPALMARAGWQAHNCVGWSLDAINRATGAGDVLLGDGHTMIKARNGWWWSMNQDENGNALGGLAGDQTGSESSFRPLWDRHGGWLAFYTAPDKSGAVSAHAAPSTPAQSLAKWLDHDTTVALQKILHVNPDGIAGPLTVAALIAKAGYDPNPPRLDTPSNSVKTVQKFLNQFVGSGWCTYGKLAVDGVLGRATAVALHNYLINGRGAFTGLAGVKL